jgi:HAD superfamily phosphoserine phosphatase-like hydrolase
VFSVAAQQIIETYLEEAPPALACFDADGTLWSGDIAEAFLRILIDDGVVAPEAWGEYERKLEVDPGEAYAYSVRVMAGLREEDVIERSEAFFPTHEKNIYAPMLGLLRRLNAKGHESVIVSASPRWLIEAAARRLDLDPQKTIAQAVYVEDGVLTGTDVPPTIFRGGKVEAIRKKFGRMPALSAGNSWSDVEMIEAATQVRLLINPTRLNTREGDLPSYARERKWLIEVMNN